MNFVAHRLCLSAPLLVFLAGALSALGAETPPRPNFPAGIQLAAPERGEAAIAALGGRLPEVAAAHRKTEQQLRDLLRADDCLWINREGRLYYACEFLSAEAARSSTPANSDGGVIAEAIGPTDPPPFDTNEAFLLNSRPGANRVIYLDFDGHVDNTPGRWKDGAAATPFDLDGDTNSFNSTERTRIIYIWQRVAEDFAMYNINVTTEDPGIEALRKSSTGDQNYGVRVAIGGSSCDWYGCGAGGVAFVGSFDDSEDTPCWVFPKSLGNSEKNIAEAASHEAGHTLGLSHDGTSTKGYYSGQGNWAPIMGVGYSKPIVQWSKGEYTDANQLQDDLAVMLNNGAVYRTDDHSNSIASATVLAAGATNGVIERNTDADFFRFTAAGGFVTITVSRAPRDSNLRLQVILHDAGGTPILTNTPADSTSGTQSAVNTLSLAAGNYYLSVQGTGNGNPLTTGYTDYASLGQYAVSVTGTAPPGPLWLPTVAGTYLWTNVPNWSPSPPNAVGIIAFVNNNITGNQTINLPASVTLGTLNLGDANDTHAFTLQSTGGSLTFNNGAAAPALNKFSGLNDVIAVPVTLASNLTINHSAIGTLTLSGPISGARSLTKSGTGTTALAGTNVYSGSTILDAGVLRLDNTNALPAGNLVISGGVLGLAVGDFTNRTVGTGASQVQWADDGGFAAYGVTRAVRFSTNSINWPNIIGNNTLILGAEDADATLNWQQRLSLAGSERTIDVRDGSANVDAQISGIIAGGNSGNYINHFVKAGGGTLAFTGQPTYYGSTTISDGTLMLGNGTGDTGGVSENTTNIIVSSGATLAVNRTGTVIQGDSALPVFISGEGEFDQVGPGATMFTLANNYAGPTTISAGTLRLGANNVIPDGTNTGNVFVSGTLNLNGFSDIINGLSGAGTVDTVAGGTPILTVGANDQSSTFSGVIKNTAGSLGLNKTGTGTLTLSGTNTYGGGTVISNGIIVANHASALGSGTVTFAGGDRLVIASGLTITNPIVVTSPGGVAGRGLLEPASGTVTVSGPITLNSVLAGGGHFGYTSGTLILSGPITASVTAVHRNGTVVFSGGGTGYNNLTVAQGTAKVGANDGIATSATVSIANSGAANLDLNGFNQSLSGVTKGANAATIGNSSTTSNSTLTTTGTSTYDGLIRDVLGSGTRKVNLTVGGGQLTLAGTNTYSGVTTINGGTLLVNNLTGSGTGTGAVTVNGGTLGGNGRISGVVTVNSGGTLSPGTSAGSLTLQSNLVLNAGSTNLFELDTTAPTNDLVVLGGGVTYAGVLKIIPTGTFSVGQTFTLFSGAGATNAGNFASLIGSPGPGLAFSFTNGVLTVLSAPLLPPTIAPVTVSGTNLVISVPTVPGASYVLQSATNLTPTIQWLNEATNAGTGGNLILNVPVEPGKPQKFLRFRVY